MNTPADPSAGLSDALAAALADAQDHADKKDKIAERDEIRETVESVQRESGEHVGPDIRGLPAEQASRRPPEQEDPALRALRQRYADLTRQYEDEQGTSKRLRRQLDEVRGDLKATRTRFHRMVEQLEEAQRRLARQELELPGRLRRQLVRGFLPALDSLDTVARTMLEQTDLPLASREGLQILCTNFERALQTSQVIAFDATGQRFDPAVHDAIAEEASDEVASGTVLRQVGRGYLLEGKLLRSAQVVVARGDSPAG
ncbi:MAG: nucleotide exchange factor GrpE [Myxococcales bacterium]|nr:nucleotide exchange factor GrpE [Myxococcales bacterium]